MGELAGTAIEDGTQGPSARQAAASGEQSDLTGGDGQPSARREAPFGLSSDSPEDGPFSLQGLSRIVTDAIREPIAIGSATATGFLTAASVAFAPTSLRPLLATLGLGAAGVALLLPAVVPILRRRFRRSRAIGSAPALLAFAILSLRLTPTLESAADFAADAVGGPLGRSLDAHRSATVDGARAFEAFAGDWADLDPSLERAVSLMQVAIAAPEEERERVLERALETVLDGSRARVSRFATGIRGPAMGIYAFGVMLPLALVGMLPVVATSGGGIPMWLLAGFYDLVLPVALVGGSCWLALKRPAIADPTFDRTLFRHLPAPSIIGSTALFAGLGGFFVAPVVFPTWTRWIVGFGAGTGIALVFALAPVREVQADIEELENGLPDALSIVGRKLREGTPAESAVESVGTRLAGVTGSRFDAAGRVRSQLGITVKAAFLGDEGVLAEAERGRAETAITLLSVAGAHGAPAGGIVVEMGEYLDRLNDVEREARRDLARTTSTLRQTAVVFAPLIAGVTVALATGMDTVEAPGKAMDVPTMGLVIGAYVLLLSVVLPTLAVVLERGPDPVRIGYRTGIAMAACSVLYPLSFLAARTLVYV